MTDRCDDLDAYVDDELSTDERSAFESHLATCESCGAELPRLLALMAAFDGVASAAARMPHLVLVDDPPRPGGGGDAQRSRDIRDRREPRRGPPPVHHRSARRRTWIAGVAGAAAAAAVLLFLYVRPERAAAPAVASLEGELGSTRVLEARLSYPGTERFRPMDVQRGAPAAAASDRRLQLELQLEQAKNWHGAAVLALIAGDREHASRAFDKAPATPQVLSDRAALELAAGDPAALDRALEDLDRALAAAPGHAPALWNRALVLARMNLPLAAALELDRVQALGEPGWSEDARSRAEALRAQVAARRTRWMRATDAGRALIERGTPIPSDLTDITGYMTIRFYDAVRAAPSRAAVEALLPLAQALDGAYRADHLTAYARRIAASDFRVRKPLADGYRELVLGHLSGGALDAFMKRIEQAGADDLRLGALVRTGRVASQLDEYRRLATATKDPWFLAIADEEAAKAERARGDRAAAEGRLHDAIAFARRERLAYRATMLQVDLTELYVASLDLVRAHDAARTAYREATSLGEGVVEMNTLLSLASIDADRYAHGLSRAYLTEIVERTANTPAVGPSPLFDEYNCQTRQYAYEQLANASLILRDLERARAELARAPTCPQGATPLGTLVRAELYRVGRRDEDLQVARANLEAMRGAARRPGASDALPALLSYIEGTLLMDTDRAAGQRALREAIAKADHRTDAYNYSVKARAYSFSQLALDAGRAGEFAGVLAILAENLELKPPARCAVAAAVQDERSVVAFADARGEIGGVYVPHGNAGLEFSTLVPAPIVDRLRSCERVTVLARAPVLGAARLLPADLAWAYALKDPSTAKPAGERRLVVSSPEAPSDLKLPALNPYPEEATTGARVLRGAEATPTRVLQEMRGASVVEFHTHGFIGNDVSEASYLVLSPELDRQFAMTARDVSRVKLDAAPLVILGACHAAASSQSQEGGMGLAEAFLHAGASAVIASPDAISDLGAPAFFAAVRDRVLHGADPAVALRDERLHRRALSHDDAWVSGVVVFE